MSMLVVTRSHFNGKWRKNLSKSSLVHALSDLGEVSPLYKGNGHAVIVLNGCWEGTHLTWGGPNAMMWTLPSEWSLGEICRGSDRQPEDRCVGGVIDNQKTVPIER